MATYEFSNAIPYAPTHVGELINDELVASGLSVDQLSEKANIYARTRPVFADNVACLLLNSRQYNHMAHPQLLFRLLAFP